MADASLVQVSFLVIARNEGTLLRATLLSLLQHLDASGEVVCLDDGSTDGSFAAVQDLDARVRFLQASGLGVANARNAAALHARGRYLFFLDAHMTLPAGWWEPLARLLDRPGVGAVQPALTGLSLDGPRGYGERISGPDLGLEWLHQQHPQPYPVPVLCGCCFGVRRDVFMRVGGQDGGMYGWGSEDCEFSLRLWRLGYDLLVDPRVVVGHLFRKRAPYTIDWPMVLHNQLRVAFAHFSESRIGRVMRALASRPHFDASLGEAEREDVWSARSWLDQNCVRNDDAYLAMSGKSF